MNGLSRLAGFFIFALILMAPSQILFSQAAGTPWAWGWNGIGQLGNGSNGDSNVPVQVLNVTSITAIAGGGMHSLALKNDGTVWAWGWNEHGELGNGTDGGSSDVPVQVLNLTGITAIAGGGSHSLALRNDGTVRAWGDNTFGELGDGSSVDSNVPVQVVNLTGVIAIAAGGWHSLALKSDGTVWGWGYNGDGALGNGSYTNSNLPVQVLNLPGVTALAGGERHSLALKNDGTVWAWGYNSYGQLGNGTTANSNVPLQVLNLAGVTAIAGGEMHSLALKNDGTVWAWGWNADGQLGNGTDTDSNVPVQVLHLAGVTAIAAGERHSLALKNDGTVWPWGWNYYGQLGSGTERDSNVPVQVVWSLGGPPLAGITAIAGGADHSLALKTDNCTLPAPPVITGINDKDACASSGIAVTFMSPSGTVVCNPQAAQYNSTYKTPACTSAGKYCDTGSYLIECRGSEAGPGPEPNQPNTINASCPDGMSGTCHQDESVEGLEIIATQDSCMSTLSSVAIYATFFCWSTDVDYVAVYFAHTVPGSGEPAWEQVGTTTTCGATGLWTNTYWMTLPSAEFGTVMVIRAQITYGTPPTSACASNSDYNDRDDLVFYVNGSYVGPVGSSAGYNLLKDGVTVVTGYTSGATYVPGDTGSHTYNVQAVDTCGATSSAGVAGTDANGGPGAPTITGIKDVSPCAATGVKVNYAAGSGATSHNLLKDGAVVVTYYNSGTVYIPGDTLSHTYIVQAVSGACTTNSAGMPGTDAEDFCKPPWKDASGTSRSNI